MASQDEIIRLVLETRGREEAAALQKDIARLQEGILALGTSVSATDPRMASLAGQMATARDRVTEIERQFSRGSGGMAGFGQTVQATGRIVQDFSAAGLNGIINNLEQMGMGLAKSAGLSTAWGTAIGGAAQLAGVALQLAMPYIQQFIKSLDTGPVIDFRSEIDRLGERIKTLSEKPAKLAVDVHELEMAKKELHELTQAKAAFDALMGTKSKVTAESGKKFGEALAGPEATQAEVFDAVRSTVRREKLGSDTVYQKLQGERDQVIQAAKERGAGSMTGPDSVVVREEVAKIEGQMRERMAATVKGADRSAEHLIGKALGGDADAQAQVNERAARAGVDPRKIADAEHASPANVKKRQDEAEVFEGEKKLRQGMNAEDKARRDRAHQIDRLRDEEEDRLKAAGMTLEAADRAKFEEMKRASERELGIFMDDLNRKKELRARQKTIDDAAYAESKKVNDKRLKAEEEHRDQMAKLRAPLEQRLGAQIEKNKAASAGLMDRMGAASGLNDPIMAMMMQARQASANSPMRRRDTGSKSWDDMDPKERRAAAREGRAGAKAAYEDKKNNPLGLAWDELTPAEQARRSGEFAQRTADANATRKPRAKRWADMTPEERKNTTPAEALKAYNESRKPLSFEEREQEQARRNAATDEQLKAQTARQLMRQGVRDPAFAAGLANKMVNERRAEMDGKTGDQPVIDNTKATQTLTKAIEDLKSGIPVKFSAGR